MLKIINKKNNISLFNNRHLILLSFNERTNYELHCAKIPIGKMHKNFPITLK